MNQSLSLSTSTEPNFPGMSDVEEMVRAGEAVRDNQGYGEILSQLDQTELKELGLIE